MDNSNTKKAGLISAFLACLVAGCASPPVVQERQTGDQALSCSQLTRAIEEAHEFERQARGERGATGTNVAAALFFWPGLLATYANTGEAIDAAQERQRYLTSIYNEKNCDRGSELPTLAAAGSHQSETTSGQYTIAAITGVPAFAEPDGDAEAVHSFQNGAVLTVIDTTPDKRWYKVLIPDGRAAYVPSVSVRPPDQVAQD